MCLMAKLEDDDEVSDSRSEYDEPSQDDLKVAFSELYDESIKLAKSLGMQKKTILTLVNKVASLEKQIYDLKFGNENLKIPLVDNSCELCVLKDHKIKELQCVVD